MGIVIRQSIKGTIVSYVGAAIGFVTTFFVLTRYLTTEQVGIMRVLLDVATALAGLAGIGTSVSIIRFYPYFKNSERNDHGFFFWTIVLPFVGFLLYGLVFWLLQDSVGAFFAKNSPQFMQYYKFIFPLGFFLMYMQVFEANANALMRIVVPRFAREVVVKLAVLIVYVLFAFGLLSFDALIVAYTATYAIALIIDVVYLLLLKRISLKPDMAFITKPLLRSVVLYTLFLMLASLISNVMPIVGSFFITGEMGLHYAGVYSIAVALAFFIEVPSRSLTYISNPHIAQVMKASKIPEANSFAKNVSLHQLLVAVLVFLCIWINLDYFYAILPNGSQYVAGKWVFFILGLQRVINSTCGVVAAVQSFSKRYFASLPMTVVLIAATIVGNVYLVPLLGMEGAAFSLLGAYILYYIIMLLYVYGTHRILPFSVAQLKVLLIVVAVFAINYLWKTFVTPTFTGLFDNAIVGGGFDTVLRSAVLLLGAAWAVYGWNISDEVNRLVDRVRGAVLKIFHRK